MVSLHVSSLRRSWWLTLALGIVLVTGEARAQGQLTTPLRGPPIAFRPSTVTPPFPQPGSIIFGPSLGPNGFPPGPQVGARYTAQLMPGKPTIPLLNNGSLNIWLNPLPRLPNQIAYTYQATLPEGDRLAKNGIVDDPNLLPVLGYSPILPLPYGPGATVPGFQLGALAPIDANILNFMGNNFARRRMAYQMYANQMQQLQQAQTLAAMAILAQQPTPFQAAAPAGYGAQGYGFGNPVFGGYGGLAFPVKDKAKDKDKDKEKDDDKKDDKKFGKGFSDKKDS